LKINTYTKLYKLWATLNKAERKACILAINGRSKSASDYKRILDYLSNLPTAPTETQLETELKQTNKGALRLCANLYDWVLRTVTDLENEHPLARLWQTLKEVEVLLVRKLYEQAYELTESAFLFAQKNELIDAQLILHHYKMTAALEIRQLEPLAETADFEAYMRLGEALQGEASRIWEYKQGLFWALYYALRVGNQQAFEQKCSPILEHCLELSAQGAADSSRAKAYLFNFEMIYATSTQNYEQALRTAEASYWLIEASPNPETKRIYARNQLSLLGNIFLFAAYTRNVEKFDFWEAYLKKPAYSLPDGWEKLYVHPLPYIRLLLDARVGNYAKIYAQIAEIQAFMRDNPAAFLGEQALRMDYYMALAAYWQGDLSKAQDLLQPYLYQKNTNAKILFVCLHLLWLLICAEAGQHQYLEYAVRSVWRWFKGKEVLSESERIMLGFLRKRVGITSGYRDLLSETLQKIRTQELEKAKKSSTELLFYFPVEAWILRELEKQPEEK
jgi:hypothetical protein